MARYRLLAEHVYTDGRHLPRGTEVGDGTPYHYDKPSTSMKGLDDEGKQKVNELHQELYGRDPDWTNLLPDMEVDEETLLAERESEPVSDQQAAERAQEPPTQQGALPPRDASPGVSTPVQRPQRVTQPNKEQAPKDC